MSLFYLFTDAFNVNHSPLPPNLNRETGISLDKTTEHLNRLYLSTLPAPSFSFSQQSALINKGVCAPRCTPILPFTSDLMSRGPITQPMSRAHDQESTIINNNTRISCGNQPIIDNIMMSRVNPVQPISSNLSMPRCNQAPSFSDNLLISRGSQIQPISDNPLMSYDSSHIMSRDNQAQPMNHNLMTSHGYSFQPNYSYSSNMTCSPPVYRPPVFPSNFTAIPQTTSPCGTLGTIRDPTGYACAVQNKPQYVTDTNYSLMNQKLYEQQQQQLQLQIQYRSNWQQFMQPTPYTMPDHFRGYMPRQPNLPLYQNQAMANQMPAQQFACPLQRGLNNPGNNDATWSTKT